MRMTIASRVWEAMSPITWRITFEFTVVTSERSGRPVGSSGSGMMLGPAAQITTSAFL